RAFDRGHALRAAGERGDGNAPGVGDAVEHFATRGEGAHPLAIFALVEEEAGLLALLDVDAVVEAVLDDRAARRVAVAAGEAAARLPPPELSPLGVGTLEDRSATRKLVQGIEDRVAPALDAGGEELRHQHI